MSVMLAIARHEWSRLFVSPLAWMLLAITQLLTGLLFALSLTDLSLNPQRIGEYDGVSELVGAGLFRFATVVLLLVVPLLTMRAFAEERKSGSLELMLAAPVSPLALVLGKFAGTMGYLTVMWALIGLMPLSLLTATPLDVGLLAAGLLGLWLVMAAFTAVGVFISALTREPTLAAIGTLGALLLLWLIYALSMIAVVVTSLIALVQHDMKKLIAYSSVAHMGFVTLGIFSFTEVGVQGAIFQMISHGLISGALFLIVGVVYDRTHTREIAAYGGLVNKMPVYAAIFMLFSMANVGLPGTSGFVGEILTMTGTFQASTWAAVGAALGVIFSAVYMLTLYRRAVFGQPNPEMEAKIERGEISMNDVTTLELVCLVPLALGVIILGVKPDLIFDITQGASERVLTLMAGG